MSGQPSASFVAYVKSNSRVRIIGPRSTTGTVTSFAPYFRCTSVPQGSVRCATPCSVAVIVSPHAVRFPRAAADRGYNFSLSGLKTAVVRHVKAERARGHEVPPDDLAASFQEAVVEVQVDKTIAAAKDKGVGMIVLGGGVVANTRLRELMASRAGAEGFEVYIPPPELCTDNAAMIACAGYYRLVEGERTPLEVSASPGLQLA